MKCLEAELLLHYVTWESCSLWWELWSSEQVLPLKDETLLKLAGGEIKAVMSVLKEIYLVSFNTGNCGSAFVC